MIASADPGGIRDRRDLARHLQAQMAAARMPWPPPEGTEEWEGVEGHTHVKTYLVEAHGEDAPTCEPLKFLADVGERIGLRVAETQDPDLVRLEKAGHLLWCDTSIPRYWRLHTTAPVGESDPVWTQLVAATPWLDNVWIWPAMLEALPARTGSQMQTFSLNHDRRPLHSAEAQLRDLDHVSMRLWSSRAADTLERLRGADIFPHGVSIRSVKIRTEAEEEEGAFCVSEYFHDGKVTVSGSSFDLHSALVVQVVRAYRNMVERIESTYGLGYRDGDLVALGDPITILMEWTVEDVEYAVGRMFGSVEPFKMWGLPELVAPKRYRARAVDLHVGKTLTFEIAPDHILLQLPRGTCGNTVVRFIAGLQYHLNSDAGAAFLT